MKHRENCLITERSVQGKYLLLKLASRKIAPETLPGQFVNVRADDSFEPLLRRPFSVCDAGQNHLTLLILLKGTGTKKIAAKKTGETLNLIGPLGNGFPLTAVGNRKPLFIAGGVGIAPFLFLSKKLGGGRLLFGAKSASLFPDLAEFRKHCEVQTATEDGSDGVKGTVIDLLADLEPEDHVIYACGPNPMFRAIRKVLGKCKNVEAYFSVETVMGCGFGACKGCAMETESGGHKLACTEGPVFPWKELKL